MAAGFFDVFRMAWGWLSSGESAEVEDVLGCVHGTDRTVYSVVASDATVWALSGTDAVVTTLAITDETC